MADAPITIRLLDRDHAIRLPLFAEREELVAAGVELNTAAAPAQLRVCAAAVGLGTRLGAEAKADYARCRCDVLVYGGQVYSWLREQGAKPVDIRSAGITVLQAMALSLAPRESEVAAAQDFSKDGAGPSTS